MKITAHFLIALLLLALIVVALGAYTRLSNAGLGCPDWPGCYGFLSVPSGQNELIQAAQRFPESQLDSNKAWIEMIHRYIAGILGLTILVLTLISFKQKNTLRYHFLLLSLLVCLQALLGKLTVTLNLQPLIVMGHLLGGFSILTLLTIMLCRTESTFKIEKRWWLSEHCKRVFGVGIILVVQIALGGWLAANYAAPHCDGLPLCHDMSMFSLSSAFQLPNAANYEFGVLPFEARLSIHFLHRIWAVITVLAICYLAIRTLKGFSFEMAMKSLSFRLLALVLIQLCVGSAIVYWHFPILLTLFHNLMAALLLITMIQLFFSEGERQKRSERDERVY